MDNDVLRLTENQTMAVRYTYLERIGSGGMGIVYKLVDQETNQMVALKVMRESITRSEKLAWWFLREARTLKLLSHPNIVKVYHWNFEINPEGIHAYFVMEFIDNGSLREEIDRKWSDPKPWSLEDYKKEIERQLEICDGLDYLHGRGIILRDLKPDNILMMKSGQVKLIDFGIMHLPIDIDHNNHDDYGTPPGLMIGTQRYMSPEQAMGHTIDGRTDIYSLGIVLFEILTGNVPFFRGDIVDQQIHNPPPKPREFAPDVPEELEHIVLACLEKDPKKRPRNAFELRNQFEGLLHHFTHGPESCSYKHKATTPLDIPK